MIVTIHQPDFLPWLGFFDRWKKSDLFVILDDVQFIRQGWHHRDRIKTDLGARWLTVPVKKKGRYEQRIMDAQIDNDQQWRQMHFSILGSAYCKAPFFTTYMSILEELYDKNHERLIDLNIELLNFVAKEFSVTTSIVYSSSLSISSKGTQRLVDIINRVEGKEYITGLGAKAYLDTDLFERNGIKVKWHEPKELVYPQLHGDYIEKLSCIDYLFNCGTEGSGI